MAGVLLVVVYALVLVLSSAFTVAAEAVGAVVAVGIGLALALICILLVARCVVSSFDMPQYQTISHSCAELDLPSPTRGHQQKQQAQCI